MRFFSSEEKSARPEDRVRAAPIQIASAGTDLAFVRRLGSGAGAVTVPMFVADFLDQCREFAPIERHVKRFADWHDWTRLQVESLQSWLPRLREQGLFLSESELFAHAAAGVAARQETTIASIVIPTANRPEMLARVLQSAAENLREFDRALPLLVADSTRDAAIAAKNRAVVQAARNGGGVRYFGAAAKERLIEQLCAASGVERRVLEFALLDPENAGFVCGANRNLLLLAQAGRAFASVDDDVLFSFARAETPQDGLTLFAGRAPFEHRFFGSRAEVYENLPGESADFIGLHQRILGRTASEVMERFDSVATAQVAQGFIHRIERFDPRVRLSLAGHYGDSTLYSSCYYLFVSGEDFQRLTADEARYHAAMNSRSNCVVAPAWSIGDTASTPGMGMALDATAILPPFFPVFHLEDVSFGRTASICYADLLAAHLPYAIRHDPARETRPIRPVDLAEVPFVLFEFAQLFREFQALYDRIPGQPPAAETILRLGRFFRSLGSMPETDFEELMRSLSVRVASRNAQASDQLIEQLGHEATFWSRDVELWRDHTRRSVGEPDFEIPRELKDTGRTGAENRRLIQRLLARYGELLESWEAIWQASLALDLADFGQIE